MKGSAMLRLGKHQLWRPAPEASSLSSPLSVLLFPRLSIFFVLLSTLGLGFSSCSMDPSHFRFLDDWRQFSLSEFNSNFFLFDCFTVDTGGLLNESRDPILRFSKLAKGVLIVVLVATFVLGGFVQVIRISGLVFGVEIRPNFGDEGVGVQYSRAIKYSFVWSFSVGDDYELRQVHRELAMPKTTQEILVSEAMRFMRMGAA
ncbi:hypothetical protein HID58_026919 [Brassica napus]|uniref:Uncharacterized protein n=1 Tax=Brassica napus TaxID=3708 RepID=A0ABQ8CQB0_BRANA|nr:hypothetical protein HID58_026919 [Brassica napus]